MVRFQFAQHRAGRHRPLWRILAVMTAFAVSAIGPEAIAQTGYSLRIRTLGTPFAGIIDDPFTDAYLNPARVGDLGGRQVYVGQLPNPGVSVIFPNKSGRYSSDGVFPPEEPPALPPNYVSGAEPYTAGLVAPLGAKLTSSFALEASADGADRLDDDGEVYVEVGPRLEMRSVRDVSGTEGSHYHALIDGAVGTGTPETNGGRYGVRATVVYNEHTNGNARDWMEINTPGADASDQIYREDYYRDRARYEDLSLSVGVGRFSRESFVREIVCGGSAEWQQLGLERMDIWIYDYDYDNDGQDPWGNYDPDYDYERAEFDSNRDYSGGSVFARLGLEWRQGLRSYHEVSWRRLSGDGDGVFTRYDVEVDGATQVSSMECRYGQGGDITAVRLSNGVGYSDELRAGLMWAVAAQARFYHDNYEETGAGSAVGAFHAGSDSVEIDAPYRQELGYERELWVVQLPVAVEWEIHRFVTWRFGVVLNAQRREVEAAVEKSADLPAPYGAELASLCDRTQSLDYETDVLFSNGITANLWDRVHIDLYSGSSSWGGDLLSYVNALVTYRF